MAIPASAPSDLPYSKARPTPIACEVAPKAIPLVTGFLILNNLIMIGPRIAPVMAVTITSSIVIPGIPPICSETSKEKAAVADFGTIDKTMSLSILNKSVKYKTLIIEVVAATAVPTING